jgi:hypothetical protein
MADQPTDNYSALKINIPGATDLSKSASMVPPGMGELNYIQTLLAGLMDQTLYTTSTPTFVNLILSGLTASRPVSTNASKQLETLTVANFRILLGLGTGDSPTFTGLTIGSLAGILKAAAGVVAAATIGTSLSYSAPTLDAIQDIRTSATPSFTGIILTKSTHPVLSSIRTSSATNTQLAAAGLEHRTTADMIDGLGVGFSFDIRDSAAVSNTIAGVFGVRAGGDTTGDLWFMTRTGGSQTFPLVIKNTGLINPLVAAAFGLLDTNASHFLRLVCGSDLTADRNLTFTTGDAARVITLSGDPTLADWFDQAVKAASSPTFAAIKLTTGAGASKILTSDADGDATWETPGSGMTYPGAGIPISTGAAWGTSLALAEQRLLGRITGGIMAELTDTQVRTLLGLATTDSPTFVGLTLSGITTGYIPFSVSGVLTGDAALFWDNTKKSLGIGTVTPNFGNYAGKTLTIGGNDAPVIEFNRLSTDADTIVGTFRAGNTSNSVLAGLDFRSGTTNVKGAVVIQASDGSNLIEVARFLEKRVNINGAVISNASDSISSFAGTVSSSGTTVTFSQASDAALAGYNSSIGLQILGAIIAVGATTAIIFRWLNSTQCSVSTVPNPVWSDSTIAYIAYPISAKVDTNGLLKEAVLADGRIRTSLSASLPVVTGADLCLESLSYASLLSNLGIGQAWTTPSFSAGDYTAGGSMTWTVEAGDVGTFAYTIIGKTMVVCFCIATTTVGGTLAGDLYIKIPASKTSTKTMFSYSLINDNGTWTTGYCLVFGGNTVIGVFRADNTNYHASTNNTGVYGQITFEIN